MNDLTTLLKKQLGFYIDIKGFFNDLNCQVNCNSTEWNTS